jgi:hypothetical protein
MGHIGTAAPVKLFVGLLSSIPAAFAQGEEALTTLWGAVDLHSETYPFDLTHYYDESMGAPIQRRFVAFENLIRADELARIKTETNDIEARFQSGGHGVARPINLDPGYLEMSKVVLASTKNFYHRIALSSVIYAEVTMHFEAGRWQVFPWTFPDFRSGRYDAFFNSLRSRYRAQLEGLRPQTPW